MNTILIMHQSTVYVCYAHISCNYINANPQVAKNHRHQEQAILCVKFALRANTDTWMQEMLDTFVSTGVIKSAGSPLINGAR